MSLFAKRKGRRISSFDDEPEPSTPNGSAPAGDEESPEPVASIRFGKRPLKQSALRRSIVATDAEALGINADDDATQPETAPQFTPKKSKNDDDDDDDDEAPSVVRPSLLGRSGSRRNKKRLSTASTTSRLSFGGGGDDEDEHADGTGGRPAVVTPKRERATAGAPLAQRVLETNAFRKSMTGRLPSRNRPGYDDDDDDGTEDDNEGDAGRPRYDQAYLDELHNSTPSTPVNLGALADRQADGVDMMDLDPSELDGAMLVDASELASLPSAVVQQGRPSEGTSVASLAPLAPAQPTRFLSATEIQERKDRRARLAHEEEHIPLDDNDNNNDNEQAGYISVLSARERASKADKATRLVRDDEELGEGYEEFVEDRHAPRALGRAAERDARRRAKQEMAELIDAAAADDGDASDDSEAERRAAYVAAQTRAGLDGLRRGDDGDDNDDDGLDAVGGGVAVPKMRAALPDLATLQAQLQNTQTEYALAMAELQRKLDDQTENAETAAREAELQAMLDASAARIQAAMAGSMAGSEAGETSEMSEAQGQKPADASVSTPAFSTYSPMRPPGPGTPLQLPPGLAGSVMPIERGLESMGTTPTRPHAEDFF